MPVRDYEEEHTKDYSGESLRGTVVADTENSTGDVSCGCYFAMLCHPSL
jgi:hypothetical protein